VGCGAVGREPAIDQQLSGVAVEKFTYCFILSIYLFVKPGNYIARKEINWSSRVGVVSRHSVCVLKLMYC